MKLKQIFVTAFMGLLLTCAAAQAAEQTFPKPKQGPYRIDWCYQWASQCGQPAADRFCQSKSFTNSNDFAEAVDIGALTPTVVQGDGQICNGPQCDGFTYVTCVKPDLPPPPMPNPPPTADDQETFKKPKMNGVRINYCFKNGKGCGQKAADAFCDSEDYDDAADFVQSSPMGPSKPTRYIGNGAMCTGPVCYGFKSITCENQP
jgi:hypothetical protein